MLQPAYTATVASTRLEAAGDKDGRWISALSRQALLEGTTIEGFQILRPLGEGGFGIVYLAWDPVLERHVALKEYMPSTLAVREEDFLNVSMRSERHRGTFDAGLRSFLNEARLLARFDHPALLKVLRFWEANGTAYMAMPYYEGPTLKEVLAGEQTAPSEEQLREWLHPLLDALAVIHRENCLHRDISPDNILLTSTGPVLLDFGAARRVISDMTQSLTAVLKPGFAPIEQYGGAMSQGPWTDIYALAGVVYYAISGQLPPASAGRVVSDSFEPLADVYGGLYSDRFLRTIDASLSLRPEARPQDVAQFRASIDAPPIDAIRQVPAPARALASQAGSRPVASVGAAATAKSAAPQPQPTAGVVPAPVTAPKTPLPRRRAFWPAMLCALVLACGAAWWLGARREPARAEAPARVVPAAAAASERQMLPEPQVLAAPPTQSLKKMAPVLSSPAAAQPSEAAARAETSPSAPSKPVAAVSARPAAIRAKPLASVPQSPEPGPRAAARVNADRVPAIAAASTLQRCSDLVLKSSLDSLSPDELTFQKSQCK
ncbi:serine/threonine protein kinase [Variovorax sp. PBS-H4]|uniref:serine/threonine protein kinase n=1 Tax=Variovorax sp. PBS-H4 TaxID=434008 RepID=UPI001E4A793B|nr:serine/threonine-protein kinase [Variovorax sp. PBS-H4]